MAEYENGGQPATDKQRNYIKFLVDTADITKRQASTVIEILKQHVEDATSEQDGSETEQ